MNFFRKHKKITFFLGLLVFFIFYEVIPELQGDKVFLPTRLFYSHPELAKKIIVKTYILSNEQVGELFLHPETEPVPLKNKAFMFCQGDQGQSLHLNLVVRIQDSGVWAIGTLRYDINRGESKGKVRTHHLRTVGGQPTNYQNFVVPLDDNSIARGKDPEGYPEITYQWDELYGYW